MKAIIAVPATALLCYRAHARKSLTPAGIVAAALTAAAHAIHPWNLPFVLLVVFFLAGTRATHIHERIKGQLTVHAKATTPTSGGGGGEGPRTHVQVLANSLMASFLSLLHAYTLHVRKRSLQSGSPTEHQGSICFAWAGDLAVIGIIANYASVAADTLSSELGILASSQPRLITSLTLRKVPKGTNGGVSLLGLGAGLLGSIIVVTAAALFLPFCTDADATQSGGGAAWTHGQRRTLILGLAVWGLGGSIVDSILGGLFQQTVKEVHSSKIVEGEGGLRVLVSTTSPSRESPSGVPPGVPSRVPSRVVENGWDWLDNNDVNFLMAFIMSMGAMVVAAWYWDVPFWSIFPGYDQHQG